MATKESNVFKSSMGRYMLIEEEHNSAILAKIWEKETEEFRKAQEKRAELYKETSAKIAQLKAKESEGLTAQEQEQLAQHRETLKGIEKLDEEAAEQRTSQEKRAREISKKHAENSYKNMTLFEKAQYDKKVKDELLAERAALKEKEKLIKAAIETETDEKKKSQLQQQLTEVKNEGREKSKQIKEQNKLPTLKDITQDPKKLAQPLLGAYKLVATADKKHAAESLDAANKRLKEAKNNTKELKNSYKNSEAYRIAKANGDKELMANLKAEHMAKLENSEEYLEALEEEKEAKKEIAQATREGVAAAVKETASAAEDAINENLNAMYGQQGRMIARLQGANLDWKEAVSEVSSTIGVSGMVSKKSVIAKMIDLVDSGVAYNLEMRAFLAETSENIASTFDATNGTLLRLIRLQQADTTTARLGMEATLNKFLNSMFKDTAYLAENISENVTAAILDASMTMNKNASLEFEYVLQKWMGALYSLGMSAEGVQNIATAINYLGTGNVSALNSNEAMQTLLAMSATKAGGKSYADMLTQGINASDTNKLLKAMIEYLAEIASTQTNMVTKSAFSEIFGMNITDLSSFTSLTKGDISSIYSQNVTYESLTKETEKQLKEIPKRLNLTQLVTNVVDNAMVGAADVIGSNIVTYGTWQALKLLTDNVDEVKVPGIANLDLINVAEVVMAGMSLVATLISALGGIGKNPTNLSNWKFDEYNRKGGGLALLASGSSSNTSFSSNLAVAGSGSDFEAVTMQEASNQKSAFEGVTSEDWEEENKVYNALDEDGETIIQVAKDIRALLGGGGGSESVGSNALGGASNGNSPSGSSNSTLPGDSSNPYETVVGTNGSMLTAESALTKMYELLEKSLINENETLIDVVQGISDKLDEQFVEQRVFYTSIISESSAPSDTSNKVSDLSSQVAVNGATNKPSTDASVTSTPSTGTSVSTGNGQAVGGSSLTTNSANPAELQEVITAAVEAAIRIVSGYDGNSGIPVYVTNLHTYGG